MIYIEANIGVFKNEFKVTLDSDLSLLYDGKIRVKFNHIPLKNPEIGFNEDCDWEIDINSGEFAVWKSGGCYRCDINLYTQDGLYLMGRSWDPLIDGDKIEKYFNLYSKINKNLKGIIIGSHDGSWGHWVNPVRENYVECLIIEGSEKQYSELCKNYSQYENCKLLNHIVTTDGGDVEWFKTDMGLSDSMYKNVCEKIETGIEVTKEIKKTRGINQIIEEYNYEDYDFIHLDIEGYDHEIITNLKYLPKIIIFENQHIIDMNLYDDTVDFLTKNNYKLVEEGMDSMAIKNI